MTNTFSEERTREIIDKEGFLTKTKIVQFYTKMPSKSKYLLWTYVGGVFVHNMVSSYNIGKSALLKYRTKQQTIPESFPANKESKLNNEFNEIKKTISENSIGRFIHSLIFPYTIASEIMPNIVLLLNKDNTN